MAIKGGFTPIKIFIYEKIFLKFNLIKTYENILFSISRNIFEKLVYRKNSDGIIVLFKEKQLHRLKTINFNNNKNLYNLIIILDGIEKPGNLGAMLRIANSIGVKMIILCNMKTYIFNSNVIRNSLGSVFTNKIIIEKIDFVIHWLKKNNIKIIVSGLQENSENLYNVDFSSIYDFSIVFGSENKGVSNIWMNNAYKIIKIPMFGDIDSLNVNSAMSIITYEIIRQKLFFIH
ncbi:TrmH family RNA methyltransferase [Blattabacterium cuenoti]|uniref:TrmH family RNA methyltransferase n=1 Tax=Blattabacterium cuenoti TaxID=1653831 RepID=UPI001EE9C8CE|nr:TrmH family RNA methyltransferase [Blattabacterium cuenoti]